MPENQEGISEMQAQLGLVPDDHRPGPCWCSGYHVWDDQDLTDPHDLAEHLAELDLDATGLYDAGSDGVNL